VSDALYETLSRTTRDLAEGIADAEAELFRTNEACREIESLIEVARMVGLFAGRQLENGDPASKPGSLVVIVDEPPVAATSAASTSASDGLMEYLGYS
jgi:hypothetical protein